MRKILQQGALAAIVAIASTAPALAQSADLAITKTGPNTATAGSDVTFSITVVNVGPDDALAAVINDAIPGTMLFKSENQTSGPTFTCSTPAVGSGGTVTCSLATFPAGSTATFNFVFTIPNGTPDGTLFVNTATINSDTPDPNPENNTASWGTSTPSTLADVGVMKTGPTSVAPGSNVTFTITVTDFGPADASSVTLNDTLGAGLTFVSLTQTSGPTFSCPGNTTPCTIATLPAGSSATFSLVATASSTPGTYTNSATVTSANDPNPDNDAAIASVIVSAADVGVVKSAPATAVAGQQFSYTVTVTNSGPDTALNAGFADTLPAGLTFVSVVVNSAPATTTCGVNGSTVRCTTDALGNGATATYTITVAVNSNVANGTILSNTASAVSASTDPNPNNDTSSAQTTISAQANLSMTKSGPATVTAGSPATYTLTVANSGPSDATSVQWVDVVPANTSFASLTQTSGPTFTCTTGATVSCSIASLTVGSTATFTLGVNVSSAATGAISNTATVNSSTADFTPSNNSSTTSATVATSADLAVTKSSTPNPVVGGTNLTYTINVTNNGPSDATSVTLVDVVPANTTFVSMTQTAGPTFTCSGTATVTCTIGSLIRGASASFSLVVQVSTSAPVGSTISNTVTASSATPDSNPANNSATTTTTVSAAVSDLSITKTASPAAGLFGVGSNITFTLTAHNAGPNTATNVVVTDTLPSTLTLVSANSTQGTCSGTTTVTCTVGTLASGATATITIVAQTTSQGTSPNTATISSSSSDPNPANNVATVPLTVVTVIPTLSPLLLALLAAALAALATRLLTE